MTKLHDARLPEPHNRSTMMRHSTLIRFAAAVALAMPAALLAQAAAAAPAPAHAPAGPQVGDVAPDFALPGATREGVTKAPVRLSDYKGKTVVIAFFPSARTRGCTIQMETYRDRYAQLFRDGKDVVVIGVSTDADTTLAGWAKDAKFPFVFASDAEQKMAASYGSARTGKYVSRNLFVVGPDGRITHRVAPFNVMSEDAYADLGRAVEAAAAKK